MHSARPLTTKFAAAVAFIALLLSYISVNPAYAAADYDYSDYRMPSEGIPAYLDVPIDQTGIKAKSLAAIKQLRQDALDDDVLWREKGTVSYEFYGGKPWCEDDPANPRMTMREYLQKKGISEAEYLNPTWSKVLEQYAIQRMIDNYANNALVTHAHPNIDDPSAYSGGSSPLPPGILGSMYENLAPGNSVTQSFKMWGMEKNAFVSQECDQTIMHYTTIISPNVVNFGIAGNFDDGRGQWALLGHSTEWSNKTYSDESETNLKGTFTAQVYIADYMVADGLKIDRDHIMAGNKVVPEVTNWEYKEGRFNFPEDRLHFRGTWSSDDEAIVKVIGNELTGVKEGSTTVHLTLSNGSKFSFPMTVVGITSVTAPNAVTVDSGTKPILPTQVQATFSDGSKKKVDVTWEAFEDTKWKARKGGEFTVHGAIDGYPDGVDITVKVNPATVTKVVFKDTDKTSEDVTTESGTAPTLPETATVTWSNGDVVDEPISWPANEGYKNHEGAKYTLTSTVHGIDLKVNVTVKAATATKVVFAGTEDSLVDLTTESGTAPALPEQADVTWSNGDETTEDIAWPQVDDYKKRQGAHYALTVRIGGKPLYANITVNPATAVAVADSRPVGTAVNTAPELPETLPVTWSNGDITEEVVTWEEVAEAALSQPGTITVHGTVAGMDTTIDVIVSQPMITQFNGKLHPGDVLTVAGKGYLPGQKVELFLGDELVGSAIAGEDGVVTISVPLGKDAQVGTHTITLKQGNLSAEASVEILKVAPPATDKPGGDKPGGDKPGGKVPTPIDPGLPKTGAMGIGGLSLVSFAALSLGVMAMRKRRISGQRLS